MLSGDDILDIGAEEYKSALSVLKTIEVPEWKDSAGNPVVIHYKGSPTNDELSAIRAVVKRTGGDELEVNIETCIQLAMDESGNKLWKQAHKPLFRKKVRAVVVARIANKLLNGVGEYTEDDAESD